ncbi:NAD(P)H-quinone oxidoreductase [Brevundimonas sp.]|uniref:NAD(P)H-quinone oxidoreductase n=1 Tax=Brevundimonas sp. TaxID=1871086 RepID=UPI003BA9130A
MTSMMTAVVAPEPGGPEAMILVERPIPTPGADEIVIAVEAAGVNRPDIMQRRGLYPPPPGASDILGLEVCGLVTATGSDVTRWTIGDRVMALVSGGGYAEFVLAHEDLAIAAPADMSSVECAAVPETFFTVWTNVFDRGRLSPGETLLIHGGSSGIGTTAIQMAKAFGAKVIVTVGSDAKADACRALGADHAVNYRTQDFVAEVRAVTDGGGADVILDMVGGDYVARNYRAAAVDGRIVQIASSGGRTGEADMGLMVHKRLTHTGSSLRPQSIGAKARIAEALRQFVSPWLESGRIRPVIDSTFALDQVAQAHARMEAGEHIGKVVLTVSRHA